MKLIYETMLVCTVHQVHGSRNYRACITNPKASWQTIKGGSKEG
jgi:hypothetical protein